MASNVEVKARLANRPAAEARARRIAGAPAAVIRQEDTFYRTPSGRLKLRVIDGGRGELIVYQRPDTEGPKASRYAIYATDRPTELHAVLAAAWGVTAVVVKTRTLYLVGATRIHLDRVEGLGEFLELEYVLGEDEDPAAGVREVNRLMDVLGIDEGDLVAGAYVDHLQRTTSPAPFQEWPVQLHPSPQEDPMPTLIAAPTKVAAAGNKPKLIREYVGRVNSKTVAASVAHMESPGGWVEPGQTPEFDEYTVVLRGTLRVEHAGGALDVAAGQAVIAHRGEWVRYSTPDPHGAEYIAVCLPAFSIDLVHRDAH